MKKTDLVFKILGLITSVTIGVVSIVLESKRKTILTEQDKDDIAERVAIKMKPKRIEKVVEEKK